MDEYLGMIKIFGGNFAPRGWAMCQGQLLSISQYTALFAILGTTYGGNGQVTFALPDMRGRAPIGFGQGAGLSDYELGETLGKESTTLTLNNLPPHNHPMTGTVQIQANDSSADADGPIGAYLGTPGSPIYSSSQNSFIADPLVTLNTGIMGNSYPVAFQQPLMAVNYIICLEGLFPSRD